MEAKNILLKAKLKATHQRQVILNLLLKCSNHPTAEYMYELSKKEIPTISLATVYKTLDSFSRAGIVNKTLTTEGQVRFDPNLSSHGHIYCNNSNEIIDYFDEELNDIISDFFKKKKVSNFHIKKISLNIIGNKIDPEKTISIN